MTQRSQNPAAGRGEILAAATDLFGETGYDGASINAIACRAGTSKANVFHHFQSKEALYLEVMRTACDGFSSTLVALADPDETFSARLLKFLRHDLYLMQEQPDRAHLILREVLESGPGRGRTLATEVFDEHFTNLVQLFREGRQAGVFAPGVEPEVAAIVLSACNVFVFQSQHVLRHLPGVDFVDDPDVYARRVGELLLNGLLHDRSPAAADDAARDPQAQTGLRS